jgi:hyperosmotically inducible periplasmic protein
MKSLKVSLAAVFAALIIGIGAQSGLATTATVETAGAQTNAQISKQVRHKLLMLPYYGVFDNLAYQIDGGRVTLQGQVIRPSTRSDAARSVARVKGVTQVVNNIKVLPPSGFDDSIRLRTYRALANAGGLDRYLRGSNPSLHIVVDRGHVTLAGVVGNEFDRRLAYITARGVAGSFSVNNELKIDGEDEAR